MLGGLSLGYRVLIATAATALLGSFANGPTSRLPISAGIAAPI
jgi:hypothetical protein